MTNFSSDITKLNQHMAENSRQQSLLVGSGDSAWMMIYCRESKNYYAMSMMSGKSIISGNTAIRPAYRIDPKTGEPETVKNSGSKEPRMFAVKIFSGDRTLNRKSAANEQKALNEHQSAEMSLSPDNQPVIISDFYLGETLCDAAGKPNEKLLNKLTLQDRCNLILQITNQYHEIHRENKLRKNAWIHADTKGSNIIVHAPENGPRNAWVIDFGSAKELTASDTEPTSLSGLTTNTIPPEVISKAKNKYVGLDDRTGILSRQSDIYILGSVFAVLLGAKDPYSSRRGEIRTSQGFDLEELAQQIDAGFDFTGLLSDPKYKIPGTLQINSDCAFTNRVNEEAPNTKTILADTSLPDVGYILYDDQLLYIDKHKSKIYNRKNTKRSSFQGQIKAIRHIATTDKLSNADRFEVNKLVQREDNNFLSLDSVVAPLFTCFINQMVDKEYQNRPAITDVQRFFTISNKLLTITSTEDDTRSPVEKERSIMVCLLQLNIIVNKGWNIELPVAGLEGEKIIKPVATFAEFNFSELEDNTDMYNKFSKVFFERAHSNITTPLNKDDFDFLSIPSQGKKISDAIISKIQADDVDESMLEKISDLVVKLGNKASTLLSFPKPMMEFLIKNTASSFTPNWAMIKEFLEHEEFIKEFPEAYRSMKISISPIENFFPNDINKCDKANLLKLLITLKDKKSEINNDVLFEELNNIVLSSILEETHDYLHHIKDLQDDTYQRFCFFGLFGYKVGEKRKAVTQFIDAIKTGEYEKLLGNKPLLAVLTQGKLGKICKPLLGEIEKLVKTLNQQKNNNIKLTIH